MKNKEISIDMLMVFLMIGFFTQKAISQNWFKLQGTEPPKAKVVNLWGFLQPTYYYSKSDVDPYTDFRKNDFNIRRARIGIRGVIPGSNEKVNYFLLTEWGRNGITLDPNGQQSNMAALTDASVTLNYIPGVRIRMGQFKVPMGSDGLKAIQVHEFIEFSDVYTEMMLQRFGLDRSVGAFRDIGVQAFDWWTWGMENQYEAAYAVMVGNGNGINSRDNNNDKDITARITLAKIFNQSSGPHRQNLRLGAWLMTGKRRGYTFEAPGPVNGRLIERNRKRYGIDFVFSKKFRSAGSIRAIAETVWGNGWIYSPDFFDGSVPLEKRFFTFNSSVDGHGVPHSDLNAMGWYASVGYRIPPLDELLELNARYSYYNPDHGSDLNQKVWQDTWTLGGQIFFSPAARLTLNYEIRKNKWNKNVGNLFAVQITAIFK